MRPPALLLLSLSVLGLAPSVRAENAESAFVIPPYLAYRGGALSIAWQPVHDEKPRVVRLFRSGAAAGEVEATRDGTLLSAPLPHSCGDDERLAYLVDGMPAPVEIAPLPCDDAELVRFGFITDTQTDFAIARRFAERLASRGGAFVLHGGDMVQVGGNDGEWQGFLSAMGAFAKERPLVAAPGNHEFWMDERGERVRRYLGVDDETGDYVFSAGPVDVVVLSTSFIEGRERRLEQILWLRKTLRELRARDNTRWLLVLFHHPPFSNGIAHSGFYWRREHEVLQRYYVPAFEEHDVDLVLSGHTHLYERSEKDGVAYVVGGAAGGVMGWFGGHNPYSKLSVQTRTISVVEASRQRLVLTTEGVDGDEIDRVELSRARSADPMLSRRKEDR